METKYVVLGENGLYLCYSGYTKGTEKGVEFALANRIRFDTEEQARDFATAHTSDWFSILPVYKRS